MVINDALSLSLPLFSSLRYDRHRHWPKRNHYRSLSLSLFSMIAIAFFLIDRLITLEKQENESGWPNALCTQAPVTREINRR